jgi:transcriptional regulator with PAS, ATPase and Fis domain
LDLYHRLNSFEIHAPALRNRPQDIPLLIEYFISVIAPKMKKKIKKISPELLRKLSEYHFPGNIRELRNLVERAIILCDSDVLALSHFPSLQKTELLELATNNYDIEKHEIYLIKKVLEISNNNKSKAAELLNITWNSLDRRIKKYNIVV